MQKRLLIVGLMILTLGSSCSKEKDGEVSSGYDWSRHVPFTTNYSTFSMPFTESYEMLPVAAGSVDMSEASGIAASIKNAGMIWAHNDSGHPNMLFLLDGATGETVARYQVAGTANIDWEDMEISTGPEDGKPYLYISDTGDNDLRRPQYSIYRFEEPQFLPEHRGRLITVDDIPVDRIRFQYPDGNHDVESLFVDPQAKDIFLVTKSGVTSTLYVIPYPEKTDGLIQAIKAGAFSFRQASSGTISHDGTKILIKNRQEIFYWEKNSSETIVQALQRTPVKAPYAGEPQGEAVCFDAQNNYYTLSEQAGYTTLPVLYRYHLK